MACSSQSALEYLRSVRVPLVGGLKSLSVIVENLYQKKVFNEEEVSEIQAETADSDKTRKILDLVINKGEEACYELLKVIYITRKRTLEKPNAQPEQVDLTSPQNSNFDLHYLISCFSFTGDTEMDMTYLKGPKPCYRYQAKLKSKAKNISDGFWTQSKKVLSTNKNPYLSYTSLLLDTQGDISLSRIKKIKNTKSKEIDPKKLKAHIPADKQGVSPSELLKTDEKNILLVGEPGIGKTAVTQQMLKLWAESDNKELDYMFYFDLRETSQITSAMSLEDLLFSVFREAGEDKEDVLEDIKRSSESVTIILDGITDLSCSSVVRGLVEKDLLPDAKIVITCRPEVESEEFLLDWASLRVEVKGFSEQSIKAYLSKMLNTEHLSNILNNLELFTLCHVPMHALMVAACFPFKTSEDSHPPRTITEIYGNILHHCVQKHTGKTKKHINHYISKKCEEILSLAEAAFLATQSKSVNLTALHCEDSCVHFAFLKRLEVRVAPTELRTSCAFRHYTMQEFFAGLWLLKNPEQTAGFVQQCLTEGMKHMKHLVPFMCGLLNDRNLDMLKYLIPAQQLKDASQRFFREMLDTFIPCLLNQDHSDTKDCGLDISILFLCQCLYESQSSEACLYLLDKLDYCLDLSGESLDPYHWCAVSYVISQSKDKKIRLKLEDVMVSEQGLRLLFGCLKNIKWHGCARLQQQLWTVLLLSEGQMDYISLLSLGGNKLHLPVTGKRRLFEQAAQVMQKSPERVNLCIHWDRISPVCQALMESLLEALPHINTLSFRNPSTDGGSVDLEQNRGTLKREEKKLLLDLLLKAALCKRGSFHNAVDALLSLFSVNTERYNILLDFYYHVKSQGYTSVVQVLKLLFQAASGGWSVDLSEGRSSLLFEVLTFKRGWRPIELKGWSGEESEVRNFLRCLPFISQLSFMPQWPKLSEQTKFLGNLFCQAAEKEQQTGEKILELLSTLCSHKSFPLKDLMHDGNEEKYMDEDSKEYQCYFLLDLYSHVIDIETQTGMTVLPALRPVYWSAPTVWSISLLKRKASLLLEVLRVQQKRKVVMLRDWSDEEREVRDFLQCLPYISKLRFSVPCNHTGFSTDQRKEETFLLNLCLQTELFGRGTTALAVEDVFSLSNCWHRKWDLILDLHSHVKDYETQTGRSVLPALQSVYQSAPAVWSINLSERKASLLLEVLKLQSGKKPVELTGWSDEESEVLSFLQCLPYMSQLSFEMCLNRSDQAKFLGNLFCRAAEREQQTGEKILELLSSVCSYKTFPIESFCNLKDRDYQYDFLLDLCSHVKDYETQTGRSVLPALQPVYQSSPAVLTINLSERKASLLLEVLKLQSGKKPVELTGWSDEESEVRCFLQCLPYMSQLRFAVHRTQTGSCKDQRKEGTFLLNLCLQAALHERETIEQTIEEVFALSHCWESKWDFLLDLCSHVKDYETQTGRSVLPALQPVYQSAPADWIINLSDRKASILLEVMKLQSEKKPVELTGWSDEESKVWSFLQCLPYMSQLSFEIWLNCSAQAKFLGNLFCRAAEREQQTGEKILELLSSVCSYKTFPMNVIVDDNEDDLDSQIKFQCDFLLDLYSHVKDYETQTGRSVLPALQPVYQSAPAVWTVDLSERKASLLLEVLRLQSGKKPVELRGCSDEESEVWSFLQCLPYMSQLSYNFRSRLDHSEEAQFLGNLFCRAAEREQQTGEKILELLSSVCSYKTFPLRGLFYYAEDNYENSDFLLDLYSHVRDYETQTGRSVLPALQPVYQSAPEVWTVDLSQASLLLEVLKLQTGKKSVELIHWSDEESVLTFLECLPYISDLRCDEGFFQFVCSSIFVRSREQFQQLASLLQLMGFTLALTGVLPRKTCWSMGRVLGLCGSSVDLILRPSKISLKGASVLFRHTSQLRSLRLSESMALLLCRMVKAQRVARPVSIEELTLVLKMSSERVLLRAVSSVASLLRYWNIKRLDLTEFDIPVHYFMTLLLHHKPLTIKLCAQHVQQLAVLTQEVQDWDLTQGFLSKVGGDLTSCSLDWELLHYLLQQSSNQSITVDLRKSRISEKRIPDLLPFLHRILFKRPSPSFVLSAMRETYKIHASHCIPSLLRSLDHTINLTCRELDTVDCAALLFTLKHGDRVKLNLLWTSIPPGEIQPLLFTLDNVSHLNVDRNLLLRLLRCCSASEAQQGAAAGLLRALQHRLDLSCSSCVVLSEQGQVETLCLTAGDCRVISTLLRHSSQDTLLNLQDCEVEDSGLELLFPVLDKVRLSKALLFQLVSLVPVGSERDTVRRAESLCRALGGELDLSETPLDPRTCAALIRILEYSDGLTELDLSHCQLTDQILHTLIPHLHKAQVLDLSHNKITDALTDRLVQLVSINTSIHTVRVFNNSIMDKTPFMNDRRFEMW